MRMKDLEKHYTVKEVAELLRCNEYTIYRKLKQGKIKGKKALDKNWLISESEVKRLLKK
jgi:excisionase family DNA binding protein